MQFYDGNLLGVVGTDVPIKSMIELAPPHKVGAVGKRRLSDAAINLVVWPTSLHVSACTNADVTLHVECTRNYKPGNGHITVKHLISAVSKFRGLLKMTYWRKLIFVVMNTMSPENKQNVMSICNIFFLLFYYIIHCGIY